jgi:hypothetical protein
MLDLFRLVFRWRPHGDSLLTAHLAEVCEKPGCPICRLALASVGRFLAALAYEGVNDLGLRAELRAGRGFCGVHAYRWLREARSVLGTALIYRDILRSSLGAPEVGAPSLGGGLLQTLLGRDRGAARAPCPACRLQREAEQRYLAALLQSAAEPAVAELLDQSDGLCRVHVGQAARLGGPGAERVLQHTRQMLQRLLHDLDEVVRKEDYRFRHEPRTERERTAGERAIAWAAGAEGLVIGDEN